jgi:hypothetical protein
LQLATNQENASVSEIWTSPTPRKDDWAYEQNAFAAKASWWAKET